MADEREATSRPGLPDWAWGPLVLGGLMGAIGLIGLAAGQPWLFPSLGPTAYLQAESPNKPSSRPYHTIIGHLVGLLAGVGAVLLLGAGDTPSVLSSGELPAIRVGAAVLASVAMMLGLAALRASHPPAAATMLLFALGGFKPSWQDVGVVVAGVLLVAGLGEIPRRIELHRRGDSASASG